MIVLSIRCPYVMTRFLFYGRCASRIALACGLGLFPTTIVLAQSEQPSEERVPKIALDRGYLSVSAQNVPLQDVLTAIGKAQQEGNCRPFK